MSARKELRRLERIRGEYGTGAGPEKAALIRRLARRPLGTAGDVERLHEAVLFLRAFPDDSAVLAAAEEALSAFPRRSDVRRFVRALSDTGIAGTRMQYAFSGPMALWLARRDPAGARIAWADWERRDELDGVLPLLAHPAEMPGVDDETVSGREWLANACPVGVSGYATLIRRIFPDGRLDPLREHVVNGLEIPAVRDLKDSPDSRTLARGPAGESFFQTVPLDRRRPELRKAVRIPIPVRPVGRRTGERLADLARACMSVRIRELEAFDYAEPADSFLADAGRGLLITVMGMRRKRRLMPEALYSGLFVKNGVPVGYWLASVLFGTAEVAYNIFPTFRGAEARWIYARLLALVHQFFGVTSFTVPRYQIGYENDEAIGSGAFWFYRKLGFAPLDPEVARLLRREEREIRRSPRHRSPPAVLRRLTVQNVVFHLGAPRDDLIGVFPYANMGHAASRVLARHGAGCTGEAARLLGVTDRSRWPRGEREAFAAFAPVALALPGVRRWSPRTKAALVRVFRAKGAASETEYIRQSAAHTPFRRSLQRLCLVREER